MIMEEHFYNSKFYYIILEHILWTGFASIFDLRFIYGLKRKVEEIYFKNYFETHYQ